MTNNPTRNRISGQGDDHKYFFLVQHYVHDRCENVYQLALWSTIKMIAGDEGECYLDTESLAALSMMSVGKCVESRTRLIELGLLEGEIRKDAGYPQAVWHLRVPDLWAINVKWREANHSLLDRVEHKAAYKSLHQVKASLHHTKAEPSPGEAKKNHIKKNQKEDSAAPIQFLPGTEFNENGAPIVYLDGDDRTYECPWPLCGEQIDVPAAGLKGAYACPRPECDQPVEIWRDGVLFRTAKKPKRDPSTLKTLGNLFDGKEVIQQRHRDIPYSGETGRGIERWFAKGTIGVIAFNDSLDYLIGKGVPRHLLAERALTAARKMFERDEGVVANDNNTEEGGDGADNLQHEGRVSQVSGVGFAELD